MEREIIADGGVQYIPQITAVQQIIYLDIDGASTNYNGEILTVENVEVQDSGLSAERIEAIAAALNSRYADKNILFVTEKPEYAEYSTIYIGKTGAFSEFGNFTGLAETLDESNQNKTDQAFVMLDAASTNEEIAEIIAHEAEHITGQLNHGGEGLNAYAANLIISAGKTSTGLHVSNCTVTVSSGGVLNDTAIWWGSIYVSSGGIANNITVANNGEMEVYNGGILNGIYVHSGSKIRVYSGGTATNVTAYDSFTFLGITVAPNTLIQGEYNGTAFEMKNAVLSDFTLNYGDIWVSSGGKAQNILISAFGSMYVYEGATADNINVNYGSLHIASGGTATNVNWQPFSGELTVEDGALVTYQNTLEGVYLGSHNILTAHAQTMTGDYVSHMMYVMQGGCVNSITVQSSGCIRISAGVASNTVLGQYGSMYIADGGTALNTNVAGNSITASDFAMLVVSSGGTADTTVLAGSMYVLSGGTAHKTTICGSKQINVGTQAVKTDIFYGHLSISSGGTATDIAAQAGTELHIAIASNTYINGTYSGSAFEMKNAYISGYTVYSSGGMHICSDGAAYKTTTKNGYIYISNGGVANSTTISGGAMTISSGGSANSTTVRDKGYIYIYSGGSANDTTVNSGGLLRISSGGTANNTIVDYQGKMYILAGGVHRGSLHISSDRATVSAYSGAKIDFTVSDRTASVSYLINNLSLISGTPTYTITVSANQTFGTYKLAQGASGFSGTISLGNETVEYGILTVNGNSFKYNNVEYTLTQTNGNLLLNINQAVEPSVFVYSSGTLTSSGTAITGATLVSRSNNSMHVSSGGSAIDTIVNEYGWLDVFNGGTVNNTTLAAVGTITLLAGGVANDTIINSGVLCFADGGTANRTTVNSGGSIIFYDNGEMFDLTLKAGGAINGFTFAGDRQFEHISYVNGSFAIADNVTIGSLQRGMTVSNGGIIDGVAGLINVLSGGSITNTRGGDICILNGGVASNTIFAGSSGDLSGTMNISSGAIHRGTLQIDTVTYCSAYAGAIIDFTLTDRTVEDGYLIDNISRISGAPTYTVTVKANQAFGTYKLAQGAGNFQETVTLCHGINNIGSITVNGNTFTYKNVTYSLTQNEGDLILDITDSPSVFISSGNILTSSGSEINNAVITGDGNNIMLVTNGGVANNTQVSDNGELVVSQGGYVSGTTIQTNGIADIAGGSADATTLNDGYLYVFAGGVADNTTVNSNGWMNVEDGTVNTVTVNVGGHLDIINGTATQIIENGGAVSFVDGANVTFASNTVKDIAITTSMTVHANTVAENITLNDRGHLDVFNGGTATGTTVNDNAGIGIYSGASLSDTTLNGEGKLTVSNGGVADNTTVEDAASVKVSSGGIASNTVLNAGQLVVFKGGLADGVTVYEGATLNISSGGTVQNMLFDAGSMTVSEGAKLNSATINSNGFIRISAGAYASDTVLNGGQMQITRLGYTSNTTVNIGGLLEIASGGTALMVKENGGYVDIALGTTVTFAANRIKDLTLTGQVMTVHSNTIADTVTLNNGWIEIYSSGIASDTILNADAAVTIFTGGIARNTSVNADGVIYVSSGGAASSTTIYSDGRIVVGPNGNAYNTTVKAGGIVEAFSFSNDMTLNQITNGSATISDNAALAGMRLTLTAGNTLSGVQIHSGGTMTQAAGASAADTVVHSGGSMYISNGALHQGSLQIANGAKITAATGSVIDFTLTGRTAESNYLINNLSLISNSGSYTITVSADQAFGTYKLAQKANQFTGTLTIGDGTTNYGTVTVNNGNLRYNDVQYTLTNTNGNLTLAVEKVIYTVFAYKAGECTFSGTEISNAVISPAGNDSLLLTYGGVADNTVVQSGGSMRVESGATANGIEIAAGASVTILGNAVNISLAEGAYLNGFNFDKLGSFPTVFVDGKAEVLGALITMDGTRLNVNKGGALHFIVQSGGWMNVYQFADYATVQGGRMYVHNGGSARMTEVNQWGQLILCSGGSVSQTTIKDIGELYIAGDHHNFEDIKDVAGIDNTATVARSTIVSAGYMTVKYATAYETYLDAAGTLRISAGGVANSIINWGKTEVYSGGNAIGAQVHSGGSLTLNNGGTANNTYINADGIMTISSGGVANSTTVNSEGLLKISSGGVANSTTVYNSGSAAILQGGIASHTEIAPGGSMTVSSGGSVSDTAINTSGAVTVLNGGKALDTFIVSGGSMNVQAGGYASGVILSCYQNNAVTQGGVLNIFGGSASDINIFNGGITNASSGSIIDDVEVSSGGFLWVWDNASASDVTIHSLASGCINGTANQVLIESGGRIQILDGANVTNLTAEKGADLMLTVAEGIYAQGTSGGKEFVLADASLNGYTCESGEIYVSAGGKVTNISTNDYLSIAKGASATNVTLYGTEEKEAQMLIRGTADQVTVFSHSLLILESSANNVRIESGGMILMDRTKNYYINNCSASAGAVINGITLSMLQYFYDNKVDIRCGQVNDDWKYEQFLGSGHTATSTTISSGGDLKVYAGAIMTDTEIKAGGSMTLYGKHQGSLVIEEGGSLTAESGAVIDFTLTGRTPESDYLINDLSLISGAPTYTITVSAEQAFGTYKLAQGAENFTGTLTVGDGTSNFGTITVNGAGLGYNSKLYLLTQTNGDLLLSLYSVATPENLQGSASGVTWVAAENALSYNVQYSSDNFASALTVNTVNTAVDTYCLPAEGQLWRVQASGGEWSESQILTGSAAQNTPEMAVSDQDGNLDLFFANSKGIWGQGYAAQHLGSRNDWNGTGEYIMLDGKNKLIDIFAGSTDANILVMTDAANGDALFVDDIYSALPGSVADQQSRIAQINEIRAGAGDDVVDMTSQRFEYVGNGATFYGGLGNDTIWASNGENKLFGDAGNDRIVGGSGNDIIIGGAGNDSMHGGGGADTFCFGSAWGIDNIVQLASGSVTLWFESGSADNWNAETLTYSNGVNSVTVSGIANESITLKFGDSASAIAGAFDNAASEKVFEDKDKALIA